jgi:predicted anti-sigma-YlaC factor YlaD
VGQPHPAARERNAANAGTQWDQLTGIAGATCLQVRQTLSLILDDEAAAIDVTHIALHFFGCEGCRRFAAIVAEFTHDLRASPVEWPRAWSEPTSSRP